MYRPPGWAQAAALWVLLTSGGARAASSLTFEVRPEAGAAAVALVGGPVLIRVRGADAQARAETIVDRLARLADDGAAAGSFNTRPVSPDCAVYAGDAVVCTATAAAALEQHAPPEGLASDWVTNLRQAFSQPYLSLNVPSVLPRGEPISFAVRGQPAELPVAVAAVKGVAARLEAGGTRLWLTAEEAGPAIVTLRRGPAASSVSFEVRLKAGRVTGAVRAAFTGVGTPLEMIREAILSELYAGAELQPGVRLEPSLPRGAGRLLPGGQAVLPVSVRLSGGDTIPVTCGVTVTLSDLPWPEQPAERLLVSNDPEKVAAPRLLLRGELPLGRRTRLLYHHQTVAGQPLSYEVRLLNHADAPARVHVQDASYGPSEDEIFVGHQACLGYWRQRLSGQGYRVVVPPHAAWTIHALVAPPDDVVSGLCELTTLEGGSVALELVATTDSPVPGPRHIIGPSTVEADGLHLFEQPSRSETSGFVLGGMYAFVNVGRDPIRSVAGVPLQGDYGVIYKVGFDFNNPGATPARFELVVAADGGPARGVLVVDGKLRETGLVRAAGEERVLAFELPPGGQQRVNVQVMPQAGSSYPLRLVGRPYTPGWSGRSSR